LIELGSTGSALAPSRLLRKPLFDRLTGTGLALTINWAVRQFPVLMLTPSFTPKARVRERSGMTQQPRRRRIEVEDNGDIAVVKFLEKKILDEQNIQAIGDDLFRLVDELGRRKILLNFSSVDFLSSAALGKLITLNRKVQAVRGKLILCGISTEIKEVFQITKLDKLFTILAEEQAAMQAF
jgi:anti-sigma B factor antagonist